MEDRCVLDIYIDENKLKLPWATNSQSGSNPARTSLRWLSTYSDGGIKASILPEMITVESTFGVKAFMDPVTRYELGFYDSGNSDKEYSELDYIYGRFMPISNYQRNTIEGLTLLSFDRACLKGSEKHPSKFVLRTVQNGTNDPAREFPPKVYFKFLVGFGFEQRIRQVLDQHGEMNSKLYQQYWQNRSEKQ
ncbi:hypothetical protein [Deefgea sp. CFH1-16]|uniref:hypothetical protein n=1 Tax=Deefgea sp. CFH1-16 TaxID=2675457 RepID=UPI0015F678BF|nr:hypothetical protein [Deefgea sp. CFH1-16]MBM5573107.1 hypothetical protein [Deefgea sp. CFH1-16]